MAPAEADIMLSDVKQNATVARLLLDPGAGPAARMTNEALAVSLVGAADEIREAARRQAEQLRIPGVTRSEVDATVADAVRLADAMTEAARRLVQGRS
jgi:hypothetical protein